MDFEKIQVELRKRHCLHFNWHYKYDPSIDAKADFIFSNYNFEDVFDKILKQSESQHQYLLNRWYNYWCDKALTEIFLLHPKVYQITGDFQSNGMLYLQKIPFHIKSYIYPTQFAKTLRYALLHKEELLYWLHRRSGKNNNYIPDNVLYVIFYKRDGEHWRKKAELLRIKKVVDQYLNPFEIQKVIHLHFSENKTSYADLIWCL
jgi:hypothetical protein